MSHINVSFHRTQPVVTGAVAVARGESISLSDLVLTLSWLLFDPMNAESEWLAKPSGV